MYKHSTTHRTLSRRLAALLAALALLAAMALPVYAETQSEDTTDTAQTEVVDTVSDGAVPPENNLTPPEGEEAAEDSTENADGDNASESKETDVDADDRSSDLEDADASDETNDTISEDSSANSESPEDDQQDDGEAGNISLATESGEAGDISLATESGEETFTIYFAAPRSWGDGDYQVYFNAQKYRDRNDFANHPMEKIETLNYSDRNVYKVELTYSEDCPEGYYYKLEFHKDGTDIWLKAFENSWTEKSKFANSLYDGDTQEWVQNYQTFDRNNHKSFAGKTMFFQNQSETGLTDVKAVFYEKTNDGWQMVDTIDLGAIVAGKHASFQIPKKNCSYIKFVVDNNETPLYSFYGQQGEDAEGSYFLYDSSTAYCYVYKGNDDGSSWTIPQGKITVYFDATFSSAYTEGGANLSIPREGSKVVYYCFKKDSGETLSGKMTPRGNNLYSVEVLEDYNEIMFSGDSRTSPANSGISTDWVSIDWKLKEPCYVADTNDAVVYNSGASRGGYWTEKDAVRDAEAGKRTTVVDIDKSWVPFRQFNLALSDYYKTSGASSNSANAATYPIYTGHFQPGEYGGDYQFVNLHNELQMNLFGFDEGRKFMVDNNSSLCTKDNEKNHGNLTVQGIVADNATNTRKDGLPVMRGTENSSKPLVEPHFNTEFLLGTNSKHTKLGEVYENVAFPFTQNDVFGEGIKYWSFDAAETTLYLKQDKDDDSYFLQSSKNEKASKNRASDSGEKDETGFFPFNETVKDGASANNYNYGFGARLQVDFTLTDDGKVVGTKGETPIKFFFSGDDDVWVFIDGKLALDVGGAHAKASGLLVFSADNSSEYATAYVSGVKAGGTSGEDVRNSSKLQVNYKPSENANAIPIDFNYEGKTINLKKGKTHTLTMYYMERGMWESNMAVAFNFPDNNELQVQKKVDLKNVTDDEFKKCFTGQKIFNFTIQNQATHYGTTPAADPDTGGIRSQVVDLTANKIESATKPTESNKGDYIFELADNPNPDSKPDTGQDTGQNIEQVLHWYARYTDTQPVSNARKQRYGILTLNNPIDIKDMRFLTFQVYVNSEDGGNLSLNNLYLELLDEKGVQKGSLGTTGINGATYGSVELKTGEWVTVKLDLHKMKEQGDFNGNVQTIRVGDNYSRNIYFRNFTFIPKAVPTEMTGFTTDQEKIPDYGSATTGQLKNAENAQYTSNMDTDTQLVDEDGRFVLEDGEIVTFSDQFRRGSYISLKEDLNPSLYDTTWTVYENGQAVTSMKDDSESVTVADKNKSLDKQEGSSPNDGRTEKIRPNDEQAGNSYTGNKPSADTIVFRSYKDPDETSSTLTKLKVEYVNTVKTGGLKIQKKAAAGEEGTIKGTYTFKVTFNDVGGEGLEEKDIERTVTIDMGKGDTGTITGIPVGTRYTIEEVKPKDDSRLQSVTVPQGQAAHVINNTMVEGVIVKSNDPNNLEVTAIFTNTQRTLINIEFDKLWKDADGTDLSTKNQPNEIYIQLQRRLASETNWTPVNYPAGSTKNYVTITHRDKGWTSTFSGLDQYPINGNPDNNYIYRIVEGTVDNGNFAEVKPNETITIKGNTYVVTAKAEAKISDGDSTKDTEATASTDGTITGGSGKIELTNKRLDPKFALDITKKDAENVDTLLKDVEFTLEKLTKDSNENTVVDKDFGTLTGVTDGKGELHLKKADGTTEAVKGFTGLKAGTYRLTETKAAKDYNLLSEPIIITFTKDGQCQVGADTYKEAKENTIFTGNAADGYTLSLTVLNRKTPALPYTGADAPSLWLLIGLPLAVAGLLILVFRYNKKGGRTR